MKFKTLYFLGLTIVFFSCAQSKLATVTSQNSFLTTRGYEFENDTVRITYNFWAKKGVMNFDVYNKLSVPIYIDLKTSAYIPNNKMLSYWQDATNTEGSYIESSYYFYGSRTTAGKLKSKSVRQERILIVSPHAQINNNVYNLVKNLADLPGKGAFNQYNSPLVFRNYLAIAMNEKFDGKISYFDNSFYISELRRVKSSQTENFKSGGAFYIPISN